MSKEQYYDQYVIKNGDDKGWRKEWKEYKK